jgi:hypothetical protein
MTTGNDVCQDFGTTMGNASAPLRQHWECDEKNKEEAFASDAGTTHFGNGKFRRAAYIRNNSGNNR